MVRLLADAPRWRLEPQITAPHPRRRFACRCENGHAFDLETPHDEPRVRHALGNARCACGALCFGAIERKS